MKGKAIVLTLAAFFCLTASGQKHDPVSAHVTTWYQDKPGAVSITFDDAGFSQYTGAFPVLEKYRIKATFSIVGEWISEEPSMSSEPDHFEYLKMSWEQLLELQAHGHELAAHGFTHTRYDKFLPPDSLVKEMLKIKDLIESRTGIPVFTMHYPYSYASGNIPVAARQAGFLFGRSGLDTINPASPENMLLLASQPILNQDNPSPELFRDWLEHTTGNWLILMYHNLFSADSREMNLIRLHNVEYSYSLPPEKFEQQVQALAASDLWIAPVASVGKYIAERDSTELAIHHIRSKVIIVVTTGLDTRIYDQPLTLEVVIPWKKAKVEGSRSDMVYEIRDHRLLIETDPQCVITITKAR